MKKKCKKSRRKNKAIPVVEDASPDTEQENEELKSVWRNRRPSPGEWMEPVVSVSAPTTRRSAE
jgi:hypothetical protein